jgi:hypothetical protein
MVPRGRYKKTSKEEEKTRAEVDEGGVLARQGMVLDLSPSAVHQKTVGQPLLEKRSGVTETP